MKNIVLLGVVIGLLVSFNSCKKCSDCTKACSICNNGGTPVVICRESSGDQANYIAEVATYEASGYTCTDNNEKDEVCTSGLFNKLRHEDNVDTKESEGFDCD